MPDATGLKGRHAVSEPRRRQVALGLRGLQAVKGPTGLRQLQDWRTPGNFRTERLRAALGLRGLRAASELIGHQTASG